LEHLVEVEFKSNIQESNPVGQVGNAGVNQKSLGTTGSNCSQDKRPVDNSQGGGESRSPIGREKTHNQR